MMLYKNNYFLKKKSYQCNALLKNFKIKLALKFTIVLKWMKTWIKSNENMCALHIKDSDHKSGWPLHKWMLQGPAEFSLLPLISLSCERPLQSGKYANGYYLISFCILSGEPPLILWCASGFCALGCFWWPRDPTLHSSNCCSKQMVISTH